MASKKIIDEIAQRSYRVRQADKNLIAARASVAAAEAEKLKALRDWNEIVDIGSKSEERES